MKYSLITVYTRQKEVMNKTKQTVTTIEIGEDVGIEKLFANSIDSFQEKQEEKTVLRAINIGYPKKVTLEVPDEILKINKKNEILKISKNIENFKNLWEAQKETTDMWNKNIKECYSQFKIPKSSGGYRTINAPNEELKSYQSTLKGFIEETLKVLPHDTAFAYVKKRSVKHAIEAHQRNHSNWFLKVDIQKFFDNCTREDVEKQLDKLFPFAVIPEQDKKDIYSIIGEVAYLDGVLPQGTPLSPTLTNLIMVPFDKKMAKYAYEKAMRYTRYADDLILSSRNLFDKDETVKEIEKILKDLGYPFKLKKEKTRFGSKAGRNWNLGLMLNKDNNITVGHKMKKQLKKQMFIFKNTHKEWTLNDLQTFDGQLEWCKAVEPDYYKGLLEWGLRKLKMNVRQEVKKLIKINIKFGDNKIE